MVVSANEYSTQSGVKGMTDVTGAPFMKTCTSETPNIPAVSHRSVSSINTVIIARRYLSGVKRKNAPAVICSAFGPAGARPGSSQGSLTKAKHYVPRNTAEFGSRADGYPFDEERVECIFFFLRWGVLQREE